MLRKKKPCLSRGCTQGLLKRLSGRSPGTQTFLETPTPRARAGTNRVFTRCLHQNGPIFFRLRQAHGPFLGPPPPVLKLKKIACPLPGCGGWTGKKIYPEKRGPRWPYGQKIKIKKILSLSGEGWTTMWVHPLVGGGGAGKSYWLAASSGCFSR